MSQNNLPKLESLLKKATVKPRKLFYFKLTLKLYARMFFSVFKNLTTPAWKPALSFAVLSIFIFGLYFINYQNGFNYHYDLAQKKLTALENLIAGRKTTAARLIPLAVAQTPNIDEERIPSLLGLVIFHGEAAMSALNNFNDDEKIENSLLKIEALNIKEIQVFGKTAEVVNREDISAEVGVALDIASANLLETKTAFQVLEKRKTIPLNAKDKIKINLKPRAQELKIKLSPQTLKRPSLPESPSTPQILAPEKIKIIENNIKNLSSLSDQKAAENLKKRYQKAQELIKENKLQKADNLLKSITIESEIITGQLKPAQEIIIPEPVKIHLPPDVELKNNLETDRQKIQYDDLKPQKNLNDSQKEIIKKPEAVQGINLEKKETEINQIVPGETIKPDIKDRIIDREQPIIPEKNISPPAVEEPEREKILNINPSDQLSLPETKILPISPVSEKTIESIPEKPPAGSRLNNLRTNR